MIPRLKGALDPYILALMATVVVASILPARGAFSSAMGIVTDSAIVLLFFLHGARLSREAIVAGLSAWRLHLAVLAATFVMFPLLGLFIAGLPQIQFPIRQGMLFLTLLPSTVQSSIAFTAMARGNVAAAVCAASFSNLLGIVLTPLLAALLMGGSGSGISFAGVQTIVLQLLVPFIAGHLLRPWVGEWVARHKRLTTLTDRGAILLVVYTAFSAAVVEGLWQEVPPRLLVLIALLCAALLAAVLALTWFAARLLHLTRADAIVLLFAGSKKSLASGVPMASVLFPASAVGVIVLPLMVFHQLQLIACAAIARSMGEADASPVAT